VFYGIGDTSLVEHALGFGATRILECRQSWHGTWEDFTSELAFELRHAKDMPARPEGTGKSWTTVLLLLNDEARERVLPQGWRHHFELVGGLYRVRVTVHANAWNHRPRLLHDIRTRPPDALLVADGSIPSADTFLRPYLSAKPDGYCDVLSSSLASSYEEQVRELEMHLSVLAPALPAGPSATSVTDWAEGEAEILALEADHFRLTDRARKMLKDNPYPDPARMVTHVRHLAEIAADYHSNGGALGSRLEEIARAGFGIHIALFDSDLKANHVVSGGYTYEARAHVKVDDNTSPDRCGRIYFALDDRSYVFVVDHIGVHNYP
jgi:hypothetical protein